MTEPEMCRQPEAMREQGIYEFFIFPIYGLETVYMSEEYLRQVAFTMEHCRRNRMKAWIFDEYTCGGQAAARPPCHRGRHAEARITSVPSWPPTSPKQICGARKQELQTCSRRSHVRFTGRSGFTSA